jgi:hypothetical protein
LLFNGFQPLADIIHIDDVGLEMDRSTGNILDRSNQVSLAVYWIVPLADKYWIVPLADK